MDSSSANYPAAVEELMSVLRRLPGIGRRGAERMAIAMLKFSDEELKLFGETIAQLPENIAYCPVCGNLTEPGEKCPICTSPRRDESVICVVEDFTRIAGIEKSGGFRGLYHVLGGRISPLDDESEDTLRIGALEARLQDGTVKELILALGGDVESRATALYLARKFESKVEKITKLAQGLPAGADLAYADSATILAALNGRNKI
jgi:recombination protein RecR